MNAHDMYSLILMRTFFFLLREVVHTQNKYLAVLQANYAVFVLIENASVSMRVFMTRHLN